MFRLDVYPAIGEGDISQPPTDGWELFKVGQSIGVGVSGGYQLISEDL